MTCERVRWLLSLDPTGSGVARASAVEQHLASCPGCRAFAQALTTVDEALAARPLAQPQAELAATVVRLAQGWPRRPAAAIEPPFSRAFCIFSAAVMLCALVGGAALLNRWSAAWPPAQSSDIVAQLWLNPSWPSDASAWLSVEAEHAAQATLALIASFFVTAAAAVAGFRASQRQGVAGQAARPHR